MKPRKLLSALALAGLLVGNAWWNAKLNAQQQNFDNVQMQVQHVAKNIYMLQGSGGNITVQVGKDGVLLVDTEFAPLVPKIVAEIRKLSNGPIRYIINTHVHPDHVGGNEAIATLNPPDPQAPLVIIAHENVLNKMMNPPNGGTLQKFGLPLNEYFTAYKDLHFNEEGIVVYHEANAHTDGDSVVLFRGSDVVSTGDVFTPDGYPFIDLANGGSVDGEIKALNHVLELTIPADHQEGGTYVVPGHGRVCDEADVVEYRDMIVIVRDRVAAAIKKNMSLDQIKAANLTRDYDPRYNTQGAFVPADRFIESIYRSLTK
jgi:cyclase